LLAVFIFGTNIKKVFPNVNMIVNMNRGIKFSNIMDVIMGVLVAWEKIGSFLN